MILHTLTIYKKVGKKMEKVDCRNTFLQGKTSLGVVLTQQLKAIGITDKGEKVLVGVSTDKITGEKIIIIKPIR